MEEIVIPEGGTIVRTSLAAECPCGREIAPFDFAVQVFSLPMLFCYPCGVERIVGVDSPAEPAAGFDLVGSLAGEYELRRQLGWATPPAVLHIDDDVGPTWSVGVDEEEIANVAGRGRLVGDRLELTLFHTLGSEGRSR